MPTVVVLRGLPASGKTTFAERWMAEKKRGLRVSRDDIRSMHSTESRVIAIRNQLIANAVRQGMDVIVDETNLREESVKEIKMLVNGHANTEVVSFLHVEPEECIRRDALRSNPVGKKAIWSMYFKYIKE